MWDAACNGCPSARAWCLVPARSDHVRTSCLVLAEMLAPSSLDKLQSLSPKQLTNCCPPTSQGDAAVSVLSSPNSSRGPWQCVARNDYGGCPDTGAFRIRLSVVARRYCE